MMTNYEIFDLVCSEFRQKYEVDEIVFTQRYVVESQRICLHFLKDGNKIDVIEFLDFLSKLHEKFTVAKDWSPFYCHCFETGNKISVYQFESENLEEIRMYENFCSLAISERKK